MARKSFWQKITGAVKADEYYEEFEELQEQDEYYEDTLEDADKSEQEQIEEQFIDRTLVMDLPIDLYHDADNIYLEAFIPGVKLENLNIELSREHISISGERNSDVPEDAEYLERELEWGEFAKSVNLPEEVDIDASKAFEDDGVLKIVMPKFNKSRKTKLVVKSSKK